MYLNFYEILYRLHYVLFSSSCCDLCHFFLSFEGHLGNYRPPLIISEWYMFWLSVPPRGIISAYAGRLRVCTGRLDLFAVRAQAHRDRGIMNEGQSVPGWDCRYCRPCDWIIKRSFESHNLWSRSSTSGRGTDFFANEITVEWFYRFFL